MALIDADGNACSGRSASDGFPPPPIHSLQDLIATWGEHSWSLSDIELPANFAPLLDAIIDGTALSCCNGSYMPALSPDLGAAAWVIEDPLSGCTMQGATQMSGPGQEVDSYWLELQGIHTLLLALSTVCSFFKIVNGAITVDCNSSASLNSSSADWLKVSQYLQHMDLV